MLIHGYHPVREALRHRPHEVRRVVFAEGRGGVRRDKIQALCDRHGVATEKVPRSELDRLARGGTHNGFLAEIAEEAVAPGAGAAMGGSGGRDSGGDPNLVVLLEDVQDPRNLGAVLRVCEGAGVGRVLIRDRGSAPVTPTVVKTSAGAAEHLGLERITNSAATMKRLKDDGYWIYGAAGDADGGRPPWELDLTGPVVLVFGGEESGIRRLTRESCDALVALPMRGKVESLNLATAVAAVVYDAVRQRSGE